jgi:hypothetical protein
MVTIGMGKQVQSTGYDKLPEGEIIVSEALTKFLQLKRAKNTSSSQNLAIEPQFIAGMMVLHMTSWDWLSPRLRQLLDRSGKLCTMKRWIWWDNLILHNAFKNPMVFVQDIKEENMVKYWEMQECLTLEAISKLV